MEESTTSSGISRRLILQSLSLAGLSVTGGAFGPAARAAGQASGGWNPKRWWTQDYRIVQTNLRETDAIEKPRDIARAIREFGGNVIVSNIGGIVAFYPTRLGLQYKTPYLKGDFAGEMIEAAHAEGLAYIGRFDLSKAMKPAYDAHPDWFMLNRTGKPRVYEGTYQACPNGGWAQDYGLRILEEGLTRYKPDGVFFNMTGYPRTDYANVNHGICVCGNCQRVFREMFGRELPKADDFFDSAWRDYLTFQQRTSRALSDKIEAFVGPLIPGVPIMRGDGFKQVGRGEVQRRVDRPAPEWAYQSGEQCRVAMARNPDKPWSSTSAAHVDYPWRQVTETAAYHQLRFAQMLGVGARLDLYLMGSLADQDDQSWLPPVSELFKWEAANGAHYAGMAQAARVGLYHSSVTDRLAGLTPYRAYQTASFRGAYSALVDSRIPFRIVSDARVSDGTTGLDGFDVIVAPNVMMLSAAEAKALDAFVRGGGLLITSGMTAGYDEKGEPVGAIQLESFPLVRYAAPEHAKGWTLDPVPAGNDLGLAGRVPLDAFYFGGPSRPGATSLLPFARDQRWGPPEFSYGIPTDTPRKSPGVSLLPYGKGHTAHIPWLIEWHYYRDGLPVHQQLIAGLINRYGAPQRVTLKGAGPVELMYLRRLGDGASLLHIVNYAGQRNGRYDAPPQLHGLSVGVRGTPPAEARALVSGQSVRGVAQDGMIWYELPPVGPFEALLLT
ncbi:alpha-amylase family protein [Sphingomonas sp. DT-204]|uniref:alpha-amylase family protein n=1 Tax=Sphingomonas sp. DT-204 TaxID=3396166 RepID=UPI003F1ABFBB